jgi:DNA-directed RNA polymerase subunit RPC12/RpoP
MRVCCTECGREYETTVAAATVRAIGRCEDCAGRLVVLDPAEDDAPASSTAVGGAGAT